MSSAVDGVAGRKDPAIGLYQDTVAHGIEGGGNLRPAVAVEGGVRGSIEVVSQQHERDPSGASPGYEDPAVRLDGDTVAVVGAEKVGDHLSGAVERRVEGAVREVAGHRDERDGAAHDRLTGDNDPPAGPHRHAPAGIVSTVEVGCHPSSVAERGVEVAVRMVASQGEVEGADLCGAGGDDPAVLLQHHAVDLIVGAAKVRRHLAAISEGGIETAGGGKCRRGKGNDAASEITRMEVRVFMMAGSRIA